MIDNLKKSYEVSRTKPEMIQDVRKRDDEARTFAPPDNTIKSKKDEDEDEEFYKQLVKLKPPND